RVTNKREDLKTIKSTVTKERTIISTQFRRTANDIRNIPVAGYKRASLTLHDHAQLVRKAQNEMDEIIGQFADRNGVPKKSTAAKPEPSKPPASKRASGS